MKKLMLMVLFILCAFSILGNEINLKVNNRSMYDKLKVESILNGTAINSTEILPNCNGKIEIPINKENQKYDINFIYNDKSITVSLASERDYFGKLGLRFLDDYADDENGISGDLETDKIYYDNIVINV